MRCEPKLKGTSRLEAWNILGTRLPKVLCLQAFVVQSPWANASEEEVQAVTAQPAEMLSCASVAT